MLTKPQKQIPELDILYFPNKEIEDKYRNLINKSGVKKFAPELEIWTSDASTKSLAYLSHGIFRYFGKFPPPVARHLIKTYTNQNETVVDPMCGSGTSALESLLLGRKAHCFDINPLSVLISRVKVTPIDSKRYFNALDAVISHSKTIRVNPTHNLIGLRNAAHWFLPETTRSLLKIKRAIDMVDTTPDVKDALQVAFLSIVRRVSKATTQQGRLFLDVETAEKDALPFFTKKALDIGEKLSMLPKTHALINVEMRSILDNFVNEKKLRTKLIICHPPYFNAYKYSGINSLELSWLDIDHATIRKNEVREFFKVGKAEKVSDYLDDMEASLRNLKDHLQPDGRLALMIGDTIIKQQYIPVTNQLINKIKDIYSVEKVALRIPKFTEASWAASQRRNGGDVGINLCDFIVILKRL